MTLNPSASFAFLNAWGSFSLLAGPRLGKAQLGPVPEGTHEDLNSVPMVFSFELVASRNFSHFDLSV